MFNTIRSEWVQDAEPCYVLIRSSAKMEKQILLIWIPDDTAVKKKFLYANSVGQVKETVGGVVKEYRCCDRDDVSHTNFTEATRALTEDERLAAMTELQRAEYRAQQASK